jgi:hypothetical protein
MSVLDNGFKERFDSVCRVTVSLFGGSRGVGSWFRRSSPGLGRERRARDASLRGRETGRAHTMRPAGSMRAEGTGEKTLEANQGHERMPTRVTATRQLERRTPRRVRAVTVSRHEAHGGSVQPIRRETFGVETLKSGSTL